MAVYATFSLILKISVILLTIDFQRNRTLNGILAEGLQVEPLWSDLESSTHPCSINYGNDSDKMVLLQGNPHHTCSANITTLFGSYTYVELPSHDIVASNEQFFFFVERHGDLIACASKYLVINRQTNPCSVILIHQTLTIYLQGSVSVLIREVTGLKIKPNCPELGEGIDELGTKQVTNCVNVKGYNETISCDLETHWRFGEGVCKPDFPSNCNASLGNRAVVFQCSGEMAPGSKALLVYPSGTRVLDFAGEHIVSLDVNSFVFCGNLSNLHVHINSLVMLQAGVFNGLINLKELWLHHNYLTTIEAGVFDGLKNLKRLILWVNQLVALDAQAFNGLSFSGSEETSLQLSNNFISSLPVDLFQDLRNLNHLYLSANQLSTLEIGVFRDLRHVVFLELNWNQLVMFEVGLFNGLHNLVDLNCEGNMLKVMAINSFEGLDNLRYLSFADNDVVAVQIEILHSFYNLAYLSLMDNELTTLPSGASPGSGNLKILHVSNNRINTLDPDTFQHMINLTRLFLKANLLLHLDSDIFKYNLFLTHVDLSANRLTEIPNIKHLHLDFLNVSDNALTWLSGDEFSELGSEVELYTSQHEICECYVSSGVPCSAHYERSPYLTCDRLLSDRVLVVLMWVIGINALCGNIFVLVWKKRNTKMYNVQDLLLSNLAASDTLMGFYMLIIASADIYFGENFPMQSETWRSGITCKVAGALSIISSEASVFFVTLISIDRFINIQFPYSTKKMGKRSAIVTVVMLWIISLALGTVPSILSGINFKFYDNSHVCIGLPLALSKVYSTKKETLLTDKHFEDILYFQIVDRFSTELVDTTSGLFFSTAVFLGLNCVCYLVIVVCYLGIMRAVKISSKQSGRSRDMDEQIKLTAKVSAIVLTDFCCWSPIILMGILVQTKVLVLPPSIFAWSVTFILPLNSAINPYLYTISDVISKYRMKKSKDIILKTVSTEATG